MIKINVLLRYRLINLEFNKDCLMKMTILINPFNTLMLYSSLDKFNDVLS